MADLYETIHSADFRNKCKYYFQASAIAVTTENPSSYTNHAERMIVAGKILWGQVSNLELAYAMATNTTIRGDIEGDIAYESKLRFTADSLIDPLANSLAALS